MNETSRSLTGRVDALALLTADQRLGCHLIMSIPLGISLTCGVAHHDCVPVPAEVLDSTGLDGGADVTVAQRMCEG